MTVPVAPFSCAASHTNPVSSRVRGPSVKWALPPSRSATWTSVSARSAAPLCVESSLQELRSQRRKRSGCWFRMWLGTAPRSPLVLSLITRFPQLPALGRDDDGVERRLQASTNVSGAGDGVRLEGCVLLRGLYQWKAAANRDTLWYVCCSRKDFYKCDNENIHVLMPWWQMPSCCSNLCLFLNIHICINRILNIYCWVLF